MISDEVFYKISSVLWISCDKYIFKYNCVVDWSDVLLPIIIFIGWLSMQKRQKYNIVNCIKENYEV